MIYIHMLNFGKVFSPFLQSRVGKLLYPYCKAPTAKLGVSPVDLVVAPRPDRFLFIIELTCFPSGAHKRFVTVFFTTSVLSF